MLFYSHPNKNSSSSTIETLNDELIFEENKYNIIYTGLNTEYNGISSVKKRLNNLFSFYKNNDLLYTKSLVTTQEMHPIIYHENGIVKYTLYDKGYLNLCTFDDGKVFKSIDLKNGAYAFFFTKTLSNDYSIIGYQDLCTRSVSLDLIDNKKLFSELYNFERITDYRIPFCFNTDDHGDYHVVEIDEQLNISFMDICSTNYDSSDEYYKDLKNTKIKCLSMDEYNNYGYEEN